MKPFLLLLATLFLSCVASKPSAEELASADYGAPPTNHVDLIKHWMDDTYGNPQSAGIRDIVFGTPVKGYLMPSAFESGGPRFGYEVEVSFSRAVPEGRRTTRQRVIVMILIRNGSIISYKEFTQ